MTELNIQVPSTKEPVYANIAQVNVADDAVSIQFAYIRPNSKQGILLSEIILSPQHAIKLQKALDDTLKKHFTRHLPS